MSFNPIREKERVQEILKQNEKYEKQYKNKNLLKKSIQIALEEVDEFEKYYYEFISNISHLVIFKELIQSPIEVNMEKIIKDLRFLMAKNYSKEELEKMPDDVYQQVVQNQKQRADILKKIVKTYLSKER
mgnify:CR=1 FL=1